MINEWRRGYPRLDLIGVGFTQESTCSLVSECATPISFTRCVIMHTLTAYMEASIPCHVEIEHSGQCLDTASHGTRRLSMTIDYVLTLAEMTEPTKAQSMASGNVALSEDLEKLGTRI